MLLQVVFMLAVRVVTAVGSDEDEERQYETYIAKKVADWMQPRNQHQKQGRRYRGVSMAVSFNFQ